MKRKKLFALGLVLLLTFTFVAPTFAAMTSNYNISYRGYATTYFNTTNSLQKGSAYDWDDVCVTASLISFGAEYSYTYSYARIISSSGTQLSATKKVYSSTHFNLSAATNGYNTLKARIYHPAYVDSGYQTAATSAMFTEGTVWCTVVDNGTVTKS